MAPDNRQLVTGFREMCVSRTVRMRAVVSAPTSTPVASTQGHAFTIIMRSYLLFACMVAMLALATAQAPNRYENFNADSIIQNERILLAYYKCVMDKGPCTKDGKNFKRVLPQTLATACGGCNSKQKLVVRKLLLGIRAKSEPRFMELLDKYDPARTNRDALYTFLVTGN